MKKSELVRLMVDIDTHENTREAAVPSLEAIEMLADLEVALLEDNEEFNDEDYDFLLKTNQKIKECETQKRNDYVNKLEELEVVNVKTTGNLQIFISHSYEDNEVAEHLRQSLNNTGFSTWIADQDAIFPYIARERQWNPFAELEDELLSSMTTSVFFSSFKETQGCYSETAIDPDTSARLWKSVGDYYSEKTKQVNEEVCFSKMAGSIANAYAPFRRSRIDVDDSIKPEGIEKNGYHIVDKDLEINHWKINKEELISSPLKEISGFLKNYSVSSKIVGQVHNLTPDGETLSFAFDPCDQTFDFTTTNSPRELNGSMEKAHIYPTNRSLT